MTLEQGNMSKVVFVGCREKNRNCLSVKTSGCFVCCVQSLTPWKWEGMDNGYHVVSFSVFIETEKFLYFCFVPRSSCLCPRTPARKKRDRIMKSYIYIYIWFTNHTYIYGSQNSSANFCISCVTTINVCLCKKRLQSVRSNVSCKKIAHWKRYWTLWTQLSLSSHAPLHSFIVCIFLIHTIPKKNE